jgi:hypothetical protein
VRLSTSLVVGLTMFVGGPSIARADALDGCSPAERAVIEAMCNAERGSLAQKMCRENQVTGLLRTARMPDLSVADPAKRDSIVEMCGQSSLIGERFACERRALASAGLPVRDAPGGRLLHSEMAGPRPAMASVAQAATFPYFNLEKWRQARPTMPLARSQAAMSPERLYKKVSPSVYVVIASNEPIQLAANGPHAQGSAVAITDSILLTNCHVLEGRTQISISQDGQMGRARLVYADPAGDRCFIRAEMPVHPIGGVRRFDDIQVGERVYSVGTPAGLERSFGEGVVSGLRQLEGVRYVQNSAPSWFGSSGGGLFDANGNLVGVTTAINAQVPSQSFAIAAEDFWP